MYWHRWLTSLAIGLCVSVPALAQDGKRPGKPRDEQERPSSDQPEKAARELRRLRADLESARPEFEQRRAEGERRARRLQGQTERLREAGAQQKHEPKEPVAKKGPPFG